MRRLLYPSLAVLVVLVGIALASPDALAAGTADVHASNSGVKDLNVSHSTGWSGWGGLNHTTPTDGTYNPYWSSTLSNSSSRIKDGYFEILTRSTAQNDRWNPGSGSGGWTEYQYQTTYTFDNSSRVTLSQQTGYTINLNNFGTVSGNNALNSILGSKNILNMQNNNAIIFQDATLNMRAGDITLSAGTMQSGNTKLTMDSNIGNTANRWNINQGTGSNILRVSGTLEATGTGSNIFNIGRTTLFDAAISLTNSGSTIGQYTNELNFQNGSTYTGSINATGVHNNVVTYEAGSSTSTGTDTYGNTGVNHFTWDRAIAGPPYVAGPSVTKAIVITGTNTNQFDMNGGTMSGDITMENAGPGTGTNSGHNIINFAGTTFTGLMDLEDTSTTGSAVNQISISGGNVQGKQVAPNIYHAVIGSDTRRNNFFTSGNQSSYGTATGWLFGNKSSGGSTFNLDGSKIYRISGDVSGTYAHSDFVAGATVTVTGHHYSDALGIGETHASRDHAYQIINMEKLTVTETGILEVGSYDGVDKSQLTAGTVIVKTGGKLVLNETDGLMDGSSYAADADKHFINSLTIGTDGGSHDVIREERARVTINQTTLHGKDTYGSEIVVLGNGILHGFGQWEPPVTEEDHTPLRANVFGNVTLKNSDSETARYGGILQPYDAEMFGAVNMNYKNVIMRIKSNGTSGSGTTKFERRGTLSTRLFAEEDQQVAYLYDGTFDDSHKSDMLWTDISDFSDVYTAGDPTSEKAQNRKAQYDPVFGFHYELVSKQAFNVYTGDGTSTENTYYYTVARTEASIKELANRTDANHLFNRDIIKSDMLGEWWFDMGNNTGTNDAMDKSIILRFRLLAAHPTQGGITVGMEERNAREAAKLLDTWRYPFETDYNGSIAAGLGNDPSNVRDPLGNLIYDNAGYDGDMQNFYANTNNPVIDNYHWEYINDFEHLLLGVQREIKSGATLNRAIRQLHPEAYASMTNVNFNLVDQFIRNRERNSVSALFQVETQEYANAVKNSLGIASTVALASPVCEDLSTIQQYVVNPIRYWTSGFGQKGNMNRRGDEYGYDSEVWGGSFGVIKETGDSYLGLTFGYARARTDWDDLRSSAHTNAYMGEILYGVRRELGFAEIFMGYNYHEQKMTRDVNMAGGFYTGTATGKYHDDVTDIGVRIGYQYVFDNNWLAIPTIGFQYMKSENSKFTEKARDDMSVAFKFAEGGIEREIYKIPLTLRLLRSFVVRDFILTPELRAGGTLYLGDRNGEATTMYVGMPISNLKFLAYGVDGGRYEATLGASLELSRYGRFYIAGNYDYAFRKQRQDHNFSLQFGLNF